MEAEPKRRNKKRVFGTQPKKKTSPGPDGQNASGWYERLRGPISPLLVLKLFNNKSNLSTCDTFTRKLIPSLDNCRLLTTPEETPDLNLSAGPLRIWSICTPTKMSQCFVPKKYTLRFASIPSPRLSWPPFCVRETLWRSGRARFLTRDSLLCFVFAVSTSYSPFWSA